MKAEDKKYILIMALLLISCVFSWNFYFKNYNQQDTVNIHSFPKEINGWVAKELPITEDEYAILETDNAFARRYTSPTGEKVYLLLVYSQTNRKVSHPPEICYTGSGATIVSNTHETIDQTQLESPLVSNKLLLEYANSQQVSYYWFKVGDQFTPNYWKQQIMVVVNGLIGRSAGSALVRVSSTIDQGNQEETEEKIEEFSRLILPSLQQYLP